MCSFLATLLITGGEDYGRTGVSDPQTFTGTIPGGSSQGTLQVSIIDDGVFESEEQFMLTLMELSQCNVILTGQNSINVTIVDDDGKIIANTYVRVYYFICI